jgi:beta-N-acetylglucosaminidase
MMIVATAIATDRFLDLDLRLPSGVTAALLDRHLGGTPMAGLGAAFMNAEEKYRVSARYLCAHAILESGWGRNAIAQKKRNLFGFQAYDASPLASARAFVSFAECIDYVTRYVVREYLTPGGRYFVTPTLRGMNRHYATDPAWGAKIARLMAAVPVISAMARDKLVPLDAPPAFVGGRLMVPVDLVAAACAARVEWDEAAGVVRIPAPCRGATPSPRGTVPR